MTNTTNGIMSQRDFSENEPDGTPDLPAANRALFLDKVRQSNAACQSGDFGTAVALYTDALALDPGNHILFSNRSAARLKQGQFALALQDATKARELCPAWPKAYFRQGVALQCLGRYGEALAAFSSGLAQDPNSKQLLAGLVEASIKSPLRHALEPTFQQLRAMKLDQSPFVVISVVGQELLQAGQYHSAVNVLEAALRIGSCSLKLRGSVFSALSSAHWALNQLDKAIGYMQQDLAVAKSLGDTAGECRAHGNLGSAYFSQGSYKEALTAHRYQLVLAMKCKDTQAAAAALTSLGHVYTAIGDYPNALASHKQCVQLVKQMGDRLQEAREIGNVGAVYLAMGEFDSAVDCHTQHLRLARKLGNHVEEARAYSNLGSSHHYRRSFAQAITFHEQVLRIAQQLGDRAIEARAYAGLGHAARCAGDFAQAKRWHEKQLEMALAARDKVGEGRACSNLGIVYQLLGEHDAALKLHQAHLTIARQLQDRAGMGRAYGNIGNAYSAAGLYEAAIKYHKQELTISKEVHDRSAEASTHGNLAVAYQALGAHDMALMHYRAHLAIARELKDTAGEACALLNLGNCLSSRQEFAQAVPYYEQYLMLSQELGDVAAEGKACHFLGYAHYCIGNYREAVRYYDQDLALAKDLQDKMNMGRAYCNLGLAHLALTNTSAALECQKYFLAVAHMTGHLPGKFRALGNIGDVLIRMGDIEEAVKMYHRQLGLARQARERAMEAAACGALGLAHRLLKKFDKALGYHTQELTLRQEMGDLLGECRAHGHLGAVHMALGNYTHAVKCYQEQLERAQELQDSGIEAQAFGNLGIARLNMGHYEDAIGYLEQQLATLEQVNATTTAQHDRARALGHLGDCYDALGDNEEAIKCHERHLQLATALQSHRDQERAYRGLGHSYRSLGNLQEALVCLEKRLVVSHELGSADAKAAAYGDLGSIHGALGNHEQAVNCLEHQRDIARELGDRVATSDATSGLGAVFEQMGDYEGALRLHKSDLELCETLGLQSLQARAYGHMGDVYEAIGKYAEAVRHFEKQLALTADRMVKASACGALGRVLLATGQPTQAINFLRQGLAIAQSLNKAEEEARIRHRLGLALRVTGDHENSRSQLETAAQILESARVDQRSPEARSALFDLQTACYHALQQILVALQRPEEALVAAERCRSRISPDATNGLPPIIGHRKTMITCSETIFDVVNRSKTNVIYFSIAGDELYAWFLQPQKRIVRFHQTKVNEETLPQVQPPPPVVNGITLAPPLKQLSGNEEATTPLEQFIHVVRDSLGVNAGNTLQDGGEACGWRSASTSSENLLDDFANERAGFLRMVNRNHLLNSSNYSLSSLFSLGSVGGSVASLQGSTRSIGSLQGSTRSRRAPITATWQGPSCLHTLYNLLLAPFEDLLPTGNTTARLGRRELILVLDHELYLVPFAVLRSGDDSGEYLCERCSLLVVPSLQTLRQRSRSARHRDPPAENLTSALVVGGPRIPTALAETWGWSESQAPLQEAAMVADMLHAKALVASAATKDAVLAELPNAESVHFATNLSWKLGAVVLSPGDVLDAASQKRFYAAGGSGCSSSAGSAAGGNDLDMTMDDEATDLSAGSNMEIPPLSDFVLSAADLSEMKLNAKLVVLSSYQSVEPISGIGVATLAGTWLSAGAGAVLVSLWPVPETAAKILLRAFYSALLQGARAARALADAMQTVQHTKHFAHPANWAGFLLIGSNVRLSSKVALIGQALCELMKTPDKCRDALRVCLHLVEKSLQRIHRGQKNAMYTTQKSIDNKAGPVCGWKELLMAVGFRFEPAANGIPSSVFFPQTDPEDRLSQCSASLQALLALSPTTLHALSKLVNSADIADDIIGVMRNVVAQFPVKGVGPVPVPNEVDPNIEIPLSVRMWRVAGCHELLASLGFDLTEVGQDQVTLRTGKQANKRNCQFVLQALVALFVDASLEAQEAPRNSLSGGLDSAGSSSSRESLHDDGRSEQAPGGGAGGGGVGLGGGSGGGGVSPVPGPSQLQMIGGPRNLGVTTGVPTQRGLTLARPPLPFRRAPLLSTGGAFISYVRRRGEPDGGHTDAFDAAAVNSHSNVLDTSAANTTDSELSDGYGSQTMSKSEASAAHGFVKNVALGYASLRGPVKVSRPGGGGESDAAFTPSPPVVMQQNDTVTMALAHQTRIRNLYSSGNAATMASAAAFFSDVTNGEMGGGATLGRRPDSSSSASSTTDWEGSGHATVLRRAAHHQSQHGLPPLPPPRQTMPLVDSLRPLAPVYNALAAAASATPLAALESTSSDSEFERSNVSAAAATVQRLVGGMRGRPKANTRKAPNVADHLGIAFLDRLSVRTELSAASSGDRKPLALSESEAAAAVLYMAADAEASAKKDLSSIMLKAAGVDTKGNGGHSKSIQESILRHMNRGEMTPISEVYHERSLGLGLAPPLSKLLLSKNYDETEPSTSGGNNGTAANNANDLDLSMLTVQTQSGLQHADHGCGVCQSSEAPPFLCACKAAAAVAGAPIKKSMSSKPWLSSVGSPPVIVKANELTTADIVERQNKLKSEKALLQQSGIGSVGNGANSGGTTSPFSELLRRDEGDGRSVADSQCSGSFKNGSSGSGGGGGGAGNGTGVMSTQKLSVATANSSSMSVPAKFGLET